MACCVLLANTYKEKPIAIDSENSQQPPPPPQKMQSHLDPNNNHLRWRAMPDGQIHLDLFDENRLSQIIKDLMLGSGGKQTPRRWNWPLLRAEEMKSDCEHVRRAAKIEQELLEQDRRIAEAEAKNNSNKLNPSTTIIPSKTQQLAQSSVRELKKGEYWQDLARWEDHVLHEPTSWNLIHLATTLGGIGKAKVRTAAANTAATEKEMNFFELVDGASQVLKREREEVAAEKSSSSNNNTSSNLSQQQQLLFTKERILRATESKILAAKCLSSPARDYPNVIEDFCVKSRELDSQAAREASFMFLSRGFEANTQWQHYARVSGDPTLEFARKDHVKFNSFYDEIAAPLVLLPCSTCLHPCMYVPQVRLPTGQAIAVGEMRKKLEALAPGFLAILEQYVEPGVCASAQALGLVK